MVIYNLELSSQLVKLIFVLLRIKKDIPSIMSILIFAKKKVFSKNRGCSILLFIKKNAITISSILSLELLIFSVLTLVIQIKKFIFLTKLSFMIFLLFLELMRE